MDWRRQWTCRGMGSRSNMNSWPSMLGRRFIELRSRFFLGSESSATITTGMTLQLLVIASILLGVADYAGILLCQSLGWLKELSDLLVWVVTVLLLWMALFGFGLSRWGLRSLWSLLG